ncbi:MmcQ/YjbR family DNA-binding protein [Rhodococcus sp. NPDC057529]|uniref:MmcQ/YjbR family DNA-binding protein n=2 Tax=unclassified Rhodococcus (in: high G+C Gram-positive bacteria) TaxID=192944 RepID=UPI0036719EFB
MSVMPVAVGRGAADNRHMGNNMSRLEQIAAELPEAVRVDIAQWDGHPTFRVRGKNFVFSDVDATRLTVKLTVDEAEAVVATEPGAEPAGYGLGRHGWIAVDVADADGPRWEQLREWIRTSYTLVAPKRLAKQVLDEEPLPTQGDQS